MNEFTVTELHLQAVLAEREREASALARAAEARPAPHGLRASLAVRLVRLALAFHREAAARAWLREAGGPVATDRQANAAR